MEDKRKKGVELILTAIIFGVLWGLSIDHGNSILKMLLNCLGTTFWSFVVAALIHNLADMEIFHRDDPMFFKVCRYILVFFAWLGVCLFFIAQVQSGGEP